MENPTKNYVWNFLNNPFAVGAMVVSVMLFINIGDKLPNDKLIELQVRQQNIIETLNLLQTNHLPHIQAGINSLANDVKNNTVSLAGIDAQLDQLILTLKE